MNTPLILELVGYGASLLIAISLMMTSLIRLRIFNALGGLVFVVYGILIKAYPVAVLNGLIVIIDLYYLQQMLRREDYFTLMEVTPDSGYLQYFLTFHHHDIEKFFPGFQYKPDDDQIIFFILRNTIPAGLVILKINEDTGVILLDYALKNYRDFKIGAFIYDDHADLLIHRGINALRTRSRVPEHVHYLKQMGFKQQGEDVFQRRLTAHIIRDQQL